VTVAEAVRDGRESLEDWGPKANYVYGNVPACKCGGNRFERRQCTAGERFLAARNSGITEEEVMLMKFDLPAEGLVRLPTVLGVLGISRSKVYSDMKNGLFPRPVKLGRISVWRVEDIRKIFRG
jgi:prophage regulatory protein